MSAQNIPLGGAQDTAVLGASTVTNTGPSIISGDVDVSPGTAVTGFPPGTVVNGSIHSSDAVAMAAHADALSAYNQLFGETPTQNLTGINLGGLTLLPGIYRFDTFAQLTGTLTLDTQGNQNATFHFLIGTTLGADSASQITLLNGNSINIFWQVGSSATLGSGSAFVGTIIADQSITMNTGATLAGRALALNGAVTLDSNSITVPTPTPAPTASPDPTATPAPVPTPDPTATPAPTATPSLTPDPNPTPSATPLPSATPVPTPTVAPTTTPAPSGTPVPTPGGTATPAPTAVPSATLGATATPNPLPTATPAGSPGPVATPTPTPTPAATPPLVELIYPSDLTIIPRIDLVLTDIQIDNVIDRITDLHHGVVTTTNKLSVTDSKDVLSDGKTVIEQKDYSPPPRSIISDKRWGFFITGTGEFVDVENTSTARGASFRTGGVTVGADYRLNPNVVIGAAFGYANTQADLNFDGSVWSNNGDLSIYATYYRAGFYVDGVATAGIGSIDTRRVTVGGVTRGSADTNNFAGLLGTGYDFQIGKLSVGPLASLRFASAELDSFHEGIAFGSLYIQGHHQDSLRSAVGLQASYHARLGRVPVTPMFRAQWQHEYLDDNSSLSASFDNQNTFVIEGPRLGRDSLRIDAGLSAQISPAIGVFAIYSDEVARENYNAQSISGGLRVSF